MEKCMKKRMNKRINTSLFAAGLLMVALPLIVVAAEGECFPLCKVPVPVQANVEIAIDAKLDPLAVEAHRETGDNLARSESCNAGILKQADDLNVRIKPIKELIGYVRSPQSFAIKLIDKHVVKIPAWVSIAIDPVGALKNKALDEIKSQARAAMKDDSACVTATNEETAHRNVSDAVDEKHAA